LLLLMFISVIGLALSVIVHLCSLFRICEPSRGLMILISVGIVIVLYPALIIRRTIRKELSIENFNEAMFDACPKWLVIINGSFIIYALGGLIFLVFKKHFTNSTANDFRAFSGHWMVFYSLPFTILYCCRRLKKRLLGSG